MRGISKTFPGVKALSDVRLDVRRGEILALMGENGAGKSTLMKVLSGAYQADPGGEIRIDGATVTVADPLAARALGIAIIYQELSLAPNLSVAENIYLGDEIVNRGLVNRRAMRVGCESVLKRLGVNFGPATPVASLSIAERQMVEIARALHARSKILVMDEPTTALSSRETDKLFDLIKRLRADGIAIVYISHRMEEVYELADRLTVLRDGTYVGTLERNEIEADRVVKMMVGRDLKSFYTREGRAGSGGGPVVLEVRGLTDGGRRVHPCGFTLHAGEVLGLAGLVGSGRTELARLIFGADPKTGGEVLLDGKPVVLNSPQAALKAGVAYLTEDRKAEGLFLDMSVRDNVNLGVLERDAKKGGVLDLKAARRRATAAIKALGIRVANALVSVGGLSGGNQQKVLLSRLIETEPRVLILDEPTRGVDVGAKSEIYRIIADRAKAGLAVLVISSDLPEVIGICDRVVVMREGRIMGEVGGPDGPPIGQESIMGYATGVAA